MLRNVTLSFLAVAIGVTLILSGCDAFSNNRAVEGRIQVLLTDNPLEDFEEANVTVRRVELLGTNSSGESSLIVLSDEDQSFNLLELQNGVTASLADVSVPAGRYNQLRLVIDDEAHILFVNGSTETLKVPSGAQTGIKVVFPHFEIESDDDLYTLTVDFDVEDSFVKAGASGMYIFKPVLKAHAMVANGEAVDVNEDDDDDDDE
jgi:hypothetical protein